MRWVRGQPPTTYKPGEQNAGGRFMDFDTPLRGVDRQAIGKAGSTWVRWPMITAGMTPTPATLMTRQPEAGRLLASDAAPKNLNGVLTTDVGFSSTTKASHTFAHDQQHKRISHDHPPH
jgi:hypothetical protein